MIKKKILVAPLNWGLGHATRSIPLIKALIERNFQPVIASDGAALKLLQKEFPNISSIELPAYNIHYAKKGKHFKLKLIKDAPRLIKVMKSEKKATKHILKDNNISGIISDNRLGVSSKKIPSVFITHQLNLLSGNTTWLSTKIYSQIIKKFNVCWVPDVKGAPNLSGKLGHPYRYTIQTEYIGPLSRFEINKKQILNDILVLISGPEPQRTLLQEKLLKTLHAFQGKIVFVKGIIQEKQTKHILGNMTIYNFMTSELLEKTINESNLIITRSGYTNIMDLAKLNKKAFFIPTPGQFEQEYLAKRLKKLKKIPSCSQDEFTLDKLKDIDSYDGLKAIAHNVDYEKLFSLF